MLSVAPRAKAEMDSVTSSVTITESWTSILIFIRVESTLGTTLFLGGRATFALDERRRPFLRRYVRRNFPILSTVSQELVGACTESSESLPLDLFFGPSVLLVERQRPAIELAAAKQQETGEGVEEPSPLFES